ncbi:hypothetical protein PPERSA_02000 [Pseudocohnilembus persalinus]|uniref:Transmembrane protein n=1 Tax=Pseudocohnilembus persalinus TaxID=266149 RepID=A0A0V0QF96_PSEPJ|nr:hypothetical protein PPERSA_02000 [Pseudocohnilembus persalinus]|eukprot:KRX00821.1 hypothetical protein PPERSA_02000 [Pseudocohnilembus persalinus]
MKTDIKYRVKKEAKSQIIKIGQEFKNDEIFMSQAKDYGKSFFTQQQVNKGEQLLEKLQSQLENKKEQSILSLGLSPLGVVILPFYFCVKYRQYVYTFRKVKFLIYKDKQKEKLRDIFIVYIVTLVIRYKIAFPLLYENEISEQYFMNQKVKIRKSDIDKSEYFLQQEQNQESNDFYQVYQNDQLLKKYDFLLQSFYSQNTIMSKQQKKEIENQEIDQLISKVSSIVQSVIGDINDFQKQNKEYISQNLFKNYDENNLKKDSENQDFFNKEEVEYIYMDDDGVQLQID